ncbi:uncharacterized protein LOC125228994 [Leguminivora glycinivorella]|uniref:uncharacterized protein LOC125228994 n=1 Tax=Leguminivora glycinivorella TaxID=1035111 RepID=UPI00200FD2CE|nr:uncharacterized protein LOC125228994 [Leguminivora glycinivorella]
MGEKVHQNAPISCPFTTELYFYTQVQKQYEIIQEKYAIPEDQRVRLPKLYGCRDEYLSETLVFEDLIAQGYKNFNRQKTANLEYVKTAIDLMARFHALSLAFHDNDPDAFDKASEKLRMDVSKMVAITAIMKPKMVSSALEVVEDKYRDKLEKFLNQEQCPVLQFADMLRSKNKKILVHRDFKPSNLMHRRRNEKLEIIPVDFQGVIDGDPLNDLLYFIFTATDEEFRRLHHHNMLDLYHDCLTKALRRFNIDVETVYSKSTYRDQLKEYSMVGLTMAVVVLPMVLAEEEKIPDFDTSEITDFIVEASKTYKERLNGIVNNYVQWGLL